MRICLLMLLLFSALRFTCQQAALRVSWAGLRGVRSVNIYCGDLLDYKLKGGGHFRQQKIVAMRDSMIVLADDSRIILNQIKAIRLHHTHRLAETFGNFFVGLGVMFIVLDTVNNQITGQDQIVNKPAVLASGALCGTGLLLKLLNRKTLRMNQRKVLQIIPMDYQDLRRP